MGATTKIDWCDASWNPVTGCFHDCPYCYAKSIANRFGGCDFGSTYGYGSLDRFARINPYADKEYAMFEVSEDRPPVNVTFNAKTQKESVTVAPYPFYFHPTLRRDHLNDVQKWKKPKNIFVCSMADLFGDWVPAEWIFEVFNAARKAPQHRYLFLTKNPKRYGRLLTAGLLPDDDNFWFGATWETDAWNTPCGGRCYDDKDCTYNRQTVDFANRETQFTWVSVPGRSVFPDIGERHSFISFEPLMMDVMKLHHTGMRQSWIIIGAETGNRKDRVKPEPEWVEHIVANAYENKIPVFMKESLRKMMGTGFRQEFPW